MSINELFNGQESVNNDYFFPSPEEFNQIVYQWSGIDKVYPLDKTIVDLFREQVSKTPNNIAVSFGQAELTYLELDKESSKLAGYLKVNYDIKANDLIGIMLNRSEKMIIAILGILKAGAAYVSIDPEYPEVRKEYIIRDTAINVLITQTDYIFDLSFYNGNLFAIDVQLDSINASVSSPECLIAPNDLAYVIYTSGTTGNPKGVMVEHCAVLSLVFNDYLKVSTTDVFAFLSSPAFDATIFELYNPLLKGNKLIIPADLKNLISNVKEFKAFLAFNRISVLWLTTTLFENLFYLDNHLFEELNYLIIGGEALDKKTVNKVINSTSKPRHFMNGYGPTESTTFTCTYELTKQIGDYNVPIGKPINNRRVYILDAVHSPVPVGVTGELYIGGAGLARGYLNSSELTAERFVANPFITEADKEKGYTRLYKTGDLVRWLPDGNIEYIGRNDDQVKIRGYRIELGEIEHALTEINGIKQACVTVKEKQTGSSSNKYLVAYYVLDGSDETLSSTIIQNKLSTVLPEYMVPGIFVRMESFSVTVNGKLDKSKLPDSDLSNIYNEYVAPITDSEIIACRIWQEIIGIDRVGVSDEFFRIGGNSILAMLVSHRMSNILGCDVKVAEIFKYKTISQLLASIRDKTQVIIPKTNASYNILSFAQERLWFIEQYEEGTNAYFIPLLFELDVNTDKEGIKYALQEMVSRHEVLRSTIERGELGQGIQRVHGERLSIEEVITNVGDYDVLIKKDINRPFDLSKEYPIRIKFYSVHSGESAIAGSLSKTVLLINTHHIANDGWSIDIFQKELYAYYNAYCNKEIAFSLPDLEIQYKDYAVWQRSHLKGDILEKQLNFWKNKLLDFQTLEFPLDYSRPIRIDYKGGYEEFILNKEVSRKLRDLAKNNGATLQSVMLSSFNILLGKYSGQDDIVIGTPIANRDYRQTEGVIGFFVNTQINRTKLSKFQSFLDLILQVHNDQIEAQLHQDLPFEKLVDELGIIRDVSKHPVFQIMFGVQNFGNIIDSAIHQKKYLTKCSTVNIYEVEHFDLSMFFDDSKEDLVGQISYATSLFKKDSIVRLANHYMHLLEELTKAPDDLYSEVSLLNGQEYNTIVNDWNATDKEYSQIKTMSELFEDQAVKIPDKFAVVYDGQTLTYRELNEKSNQLARHIRTQYEETAKHSFSSDTVIALCIDRSLEMVVGMLAILKAGGAYVPIDPGYPQERIEHILEDTQAKLLLSQKNPAECQNKIQLPNVKVIYIDLTEELYYETNNVNLPVFSKATDLAYLIYTSGTTGKPKGVMVEQKGVINLIEDLINKYDIAPDERFLLFSNYVFDASAEQLYLSLFSGGTLYIIDNTSILDTNLFENFVVYNGITHLDSTPSYLATVDPSKLTSLKRLVFGAELLSKSLFDKFRAFIPAVYNAYGPTEATITCLLTLDSAELSKSSIQNTKAYILDSNRKPVPVGVIGELYIGGAGLARGYLNRPELTAEYFVANPFANAFDKEKGFLRLYKTGDIGRWLSDGSIEYRGRNDDQVKINGYRIELGEIEHALTLIDGISQSCVLVKEREVAAKSTKYLVGYYVLTDADLAQTTIQKKLSEILPAFMLPTFLIHMESFPLTDNGKLDKRSLPDPQFSLLAMEYVPPSSDTEIEICKILQEILGLDRVGVTDNFFQMGGNSIMAIQVSHRINKSLGWEVKVADLFRYPSCDKLIFYCNINSIAYVEGEL